MRLTSKYGQNAKTWSNVSKYVLLLSTPQYYRDPAVKYGYMRGQETVDYVSRITRRWLQYKGVKTAAGGGSLDIRQRSWFNPNFEFQWFFLPNLIGMLSFMLGLVVTGLSIAREREAGTFDQLLVSPATPTEIALAKLIPGCVVGLAHGTIFLLVSVFGFGVPFTGSVVLLYVAIFIFSLAAGGIGLMISSLSSTQQQAFLGAFTVGVPCILLSGAVTPVINMPMFLQHGSQLNPIRHFTTLVQGVFLRDITFEAASVSLLKICAITVVCVCVAVWMFRRRV